MSPTNYDGPDRPCCVHILRDMAKVFDEEMCRLGLDYTASFGTLLGLQREGRLIPWTMDNDYSLTTQNANAMVRHWDTNSTGLTHFFQEINRMCITKDFAGGKLQKWELPYFRPKPCTDFYIGNNNGSMFHENFGDCIHNFTDVWPSQRRLVYNGSFYQNVPAHPDRVLERYYGKG